MLNDAVMIFFCFNNIKMRYLKKVPLVICIELYHLINLNFPDLEWRNFEQTRSNIFNVQISWMISDIKIRDCLLFQSHLCLRVVISHHNIADIFSNKLHQCKWSIKELTHLHLGFTPPKKIKKHHTSYPKIIKKVCQCLVK